MSEANYRGVAMRSVFNLAAGLVAAVGLVTPAQGQTGSIEGDVFIATRAGTVMQGAAVAVRLAPMSDALARAVVSGCAVASEEKAKAPTGRLAPDPKDFPALTDSKRKTHEMSAVSVGWNRLNAVLDSSAVLRSTTGMTALRMLQGPGPWAVKVIVTWDDDSGTGRKWIGAVTRRAPV